MTDIDQTRITTNPLPSNWAGVTYFPKPHGADHDDDTEEYTGPVLMEDNDTIWVNVFGEPLSFGKDNCVIRRSNA